MKGLTDKQQEILDFVSEFTRNEGMAPTINEISEKFQIKSATAFAHVRALQRKGYVNRSSKARSLALTQSEARPRHYSMSLSIPLLGRISAGVPVEAEENVEKTLQFDPRMLPGHIGGYKLFALKVQGESMRNLGILDGDTIIVKQCNNAAIGDVVVAMVDGEVTVKSLYITDDKMWELRPANPDYKSRYIPLDRLNIQGVVIALHRTL